MTSPHGEDGSARAIAAAFLANLGIALAKFVAFAMTGAASMLAEAVHSVADTGNQGYWFVAADGGIFSFGDAKSFAPKLGGSPVTGVAVSPDGDGLWVTRANGEVTGYGSVPSLGSVTTALSQPVVGIAALQIVDGAAPAA